MMKTTVHINVSDHTVPVEVDHDPDAEPIQIAASAKAVLDEATLTVGNETFTPADIDEWWA